MKQKITIKEAQGLGVCEKLNCLAYRPERPPLPIHKTCWATDEAAQYGYCSKNGAVEFLPKKK